MRYHLAIIGSGAAGFAAAIAARRRGLQVIMIEAGTTGGTCVNNGCVPSKALLAAVEARHTAGTADRFPGIRGTAWPADFAALIAGKAALVDGMRAEKYADLATEYGWQIHHGTARFVPGPAVEVTGTDGRTRLVVADQYLIATGAAPMVPPIDGLDEAGYLTSTTAMQLKSLPESLLVIGGNAVGLEQAQLFNRLGSLVTVVEALDRLAPNDEPEVGAAIAGVFADDAIGVHTGTSLIAVRRDGPLTVATVRSGRSAHDVELRAAQLLVATGRRPVTDRLNLDAVEVQVGPRGDVAVDDQLRTTNPRIWAAGDVTGHPQFVYVAAAHGSIVVENAFDGAGRAVDYRTLPRVTFTSPAIATVGLTEADATALGIACETRVLPMTHVPRAIVNRDTRGLVKLVAEHGSGRLVGASVVADGAGDVIAIAEYALHNGMTVHEMADLWLPYLTAAESLQLAARSFSRDISMLSCCAA